MGGKVPGIFLLSSLRNSSTVERAGTENYEEKIPAAALSELDKWAEPYHANRCYDETPNQLAISDA